jgi:hypothetical protein
MKPKKMLLVLLVFILPTGAWCQLEKGSYLGSASAGFSFQNNNYPSGDFSSKSSSFNVSLNNGFGIFVANQLAIGPRFNITTGYSSNIFGNSTTGEIKTSTTSYFLSLDPFVRYYYFHHGKVAFFGELSGIIGYGQQFENYKPESSENQKTTYDNLHYGGGLAVGFVYFITQNIGIETSIWYQFDGLESKHSSDNNHFNNKGTSGELAINAGFAFYIGKCKKKDKDIQAIP